MGPGHPEEAAAAVCCLVLSGGCAPGTEGQSEATHTRRESCRAELGTGREATPRAPASHSPLPEVHGLHCVAGEGEEGSSSPLLAAGRMTAEGRAASASNHCSQSWAKGQFSEDAPLLPALE